MHTYAHTLTHPHRQLWFSSKRRLKLIICELLKLIYVYIQMTLLTDLWGTPHCGVVVIDIFYRYMTFTATQRIIPFASMCIYKLSCRRTSARLGWRNVRLPVVRRLLLLMTSPKPLNLFQPTLIEIISRESDSDLFKSKGKQVETNGHNFLRKNILKTFSWTTSSNALLFGMGHP